ncbi:LysR family transcriptional regulator [Ferviditalea candida]|uniref:LysR family transcriptional regulator n=1 Tax=Ferviditalea candida TaxID=3108399 RepID=A0ABU5ZE14_9BACL|nr:LysR family transcriptional regulator [Paenibacillaceae bacterium T2]
MDLRQIRYFVTIAKEGQITRAAQKLNMAQPPLSQLLRQMEEELNTPLLERNGRNLELTEAGRILRQKGEILLQQFAETLREVKETGEGMRGTLAIGTVISSLSHLPPKIVQFRSRYPEVTYKIERGDTSTLSALLINRDIEVAIVRLPVDSDQFEVLRLPDEPYVLLAPEDWYGSETSLRMEQLERVPLLLLHRTNIRGVYEIIVNECRRAGFEPNIVAECADPTILITLVGAGIGATILSKSALSLFPLRNIKIIELENCSIQSEAAVIWLKDRYLSKAAQRFVEMFGDREIASDRFSSAPDL